MSLVKFDLYVKMICCLINHFFIRLIDGKYGSAMAPLVEKLEKVPAIRVFSMSKQHKDSL